jgi:hypothetical protein
MHGRWQGRYKSYSMGHLYTGNVLGNPGYGRCVLFQMLDARGAEHRTRHGGCVKQKQERRIQRWLSQFRYALAGAVAREYEQWIVLQHPQQVPRRLSARGNQRAKIEETLTQGSSTDDGLADTFKRVD